MAGQALRHNTSNPITEGIWRIDLPRGGTAIRKVIRGDLPPRHPDWTASDDPRAWNYWRREALVYADDPLAAHADTGLRLPRLLAVDQRSDGAVELLLEDVRGRSGAALTRDDLVTAARRLGRVQARWSLAPTDRPWASRGFLRAFTSSKHVSAELLRDPEAWRHPLIASTWPADLRPALVALHDERERLFRLLEGSPRTLGHLDLWSENLVAAEDGTTAVLDWAASGDAALGEDLGNLVAEAALDELVPATELEPLARALVPAYVDGLRAEGWTGTPEEVTRAFRASGVKWHWLGALHLERARTGAHHQYGGSAAPDPGEQYAARGAALRVLAGWALDALAPLGGSGG